MTIQTAAPKRGPGRRPDQVLERLAQAARGAPASCVQPFSEQRARIDHHVDAGRTARSAARSSAACSTGCGCRGQRRQPCSTPAIARRRTRTSPAAPSRPRRAPRRRRRTCARVKPSGAGEQRRRELLDAGVVFLDRVVEEAAAPPRSCSRCRDSSDRNCWRFWVGLEVRIGLRQREQLPQRAVSCCSRPGPAAPAPAPSWRGVACAHHRFEGAALSARRSPLPS